MTDAHLADGIRNLLAEDKRAEAFDTFYRGTGMPDELIEAMRDDVAVLDVAHDRGARVSGATTWACPSITRREGCDVLRW